MLSIDRHRRLVLLLSLVSGGGAMGQDVTLRLPVVDTFQVNTVVSVPDQGSALLGSVGRAADGSSQYGFSPRGSSVGLERSYRSASASVYIHDFAAMDAELLATPTDRHDNWVAPMSPLAANAFRSLQRGAAPGQAQRVRLTGESPTASHPTAVIRSNNSLTPTAVRAPTTGLPTGATVAQQRFRRQPPPAATQSSGAADSSPPAASSFETNASESPAASRASR